MAKWSASARRAWGFWGGGTILFAAVSLFTDLTFLPGSGSTARHIQQKGLDDLIGGFMIGALLMAPLSLTAYGLGRFMARGQRSKTPTVPPPAPPQ